MWKTLKEYIILIIEAETMKQVEMKKKKLRKSISGEAKSYSRQNYIAENLSKE